jgi:hypothetical protein
VIASLCVFQEMTQPLMPAPAQVMIENKQGNEAAPPQLRQDSAAAIVATIEARRGIFPIHSDQTSAH